jgi:hypothetical protein
VTSDLPQAFVSARTSKLRGADSLSTAVELFVVQIHRVFDGILGGSPILPAEHLGLFARL